MPVPKDEKHNGQVRSNSRNAGVALIGQVDAYEIVLSISRLPVVKIYGCDLMRSNGLFAEEVFDEQRIAFNIQGLWHGEGHVRDEKREDEKEKEDDYASCACLGQKENARSHNEQSDNGEQNIPVPASGHFAVILRGEQVRAFGADKLDDFFITSQLRTRRNGHIAIHVVQFEGIAPA